MSNNKFQQILYNTFNLTISNVIKYSPTVPVTQAQKDKSVHHSYVDLIKAESPPLPKELIEKCINNKQLNMTYFSRHTTNI